MLKTSTVLIYQKDVGKYTVCNRKKDKKRDRNICKNGYNMNRKKHKKNTFSSNDNIEMKRKIAETVNKNIEKNTSSRNDKDKKKRIVVDSVNDNNNNNNNISNNNNNNNNRTLIIRFSIFDKTYLMNHILLRKQYPIFNTYRISESIS